MYCHFRYGKLPLNPNLVALTNPFIPVEGIFWVDQNDNQFIDQDGNNIIFLEPA